MTCVFIVVVGLSGGRFSDEKGCCLSSKTREKNVCRGRMIELSTEMARVAEVASRLTAVNICPICPQLTITRAAHALHELIKMTNKFTRGGHYQLS